MKFHDFPGQENEILELHDFSGFPSLDKSLGQPENGLQRGFAKHALNSSLRSMRFVWFRSKERPPRSFTRPIFRAVFDSRSSFFAPKPYGNACYTC